jgi:hypothetical protein
MNKSTKTIEFKIERTIPAPPSEELGVGMLWRGASDTALRLLARNSRIDRYPSSMNVMA